MQTNILSFGLILAAAAAAVTADALGDTISAQQTPGADYSFGGEFTAITTPAVLLGLPAPSGAPGFQTFCIESEVDFTPGAPLNYALTQSDHAGNPLSLGTAWLFSEFSTGTLSGYNYTIGAGRIDSAKNLQAALWILQGETLPAPFVGLGAADVALATAATSGNELKPSLGAYDVQVLALVNARTGASSQDLLGFGGVPISGVPEGGQTLALLSVGMACTVGLRARNPECQSKA